LKVTRCIGIEPVENGWVVVETIFHEEDSEEADTVEHSGYDPAAAYGGEKSERAEGCLLKKERVHVFTDHLKLMAFVNDRTKKS